jgi:hypothetical protein
MQRFEWRRKMLRQTTSPGLQAPQSALVTRALEITTEQPGLAASGQAVALPYGLRVAPSHVAVSRFAALQQALIPPR